MIGLGMNLEKAIDHDVHNEHNGKTKRYVLFETHPLGDGSEGVEILAFRCARGVVAV